MDRRFALAFFLSLVVLFVWFSLQPPPPEVPVEPAGSVEQASAAVAEGGGNSVAPSAAEGEARPAATVAASEEKEIVLEVGRPNGVQTRPGHYLAVFSNRGGVLRELSFGSYYTVLGLSAQERADTSFWMPAVKSYETASGATASMLFEPGTSARALAPGGLDDVLWEWEEIKGAEPGMRFRYGPGTGVVFTKEITFPQDTYHVRLVLTLENTGFEGKSRKAEFSLVPAGCMPEELGDSFYPEPRSVAVGWDKDDERYEFEDKDAQSAKPPGEAFQLPLPISLAGVHNKYFAFLLRGTDGASRATMVGARYRPVEPLPPPPGEKGPGPLIQTAVQLNLTIPSPGETERYEYLAYVGPKSRESMIADFEGHEVVLDADLSGWTIFSVIGRGLLFILGLFHAVTGNWGISIILLTICVRAVLFPLNRRSQTAMARYQKKMKRVQPKLNEIKERFKNDPQKQREAQARIMQEERAFPPLGGCMPVLLQIPIFFGLFAALRTSFDLRQAPFLGWIHDLSRPDHLLQLDLEIPLLITTLDLTYLNILPLLMVVLWILQQKGMPAPADEQAARMQKMMMFMPIMFGFLLYNYAAGLSLYMITQSGLGIVEQRFIKKMWPIDDNEPEVKKRAGCGPFSGMLENLAEKQRAQVKRVEEMKRQQQSQGARKQKKRKR